MSSASKAQLEFRAICDRWSELFEKFTDDAERIEWVQEKLAGLCLNQSLFAGILQNILKGSRYPDIRQAQMFDNELLLYLNPKRLFSIRMYIYDPGSFTPIHDHNSWGISGSALGELSVVKYLREDDASAEGFARLKQTRPITLNPGETELTLALNKGIHQTGNPTGQTVIMISVYGSPVRRLYINGFDMENNRVYKMYPPRIRKKLLAADALKYIIV